jgi:DnaJ family protein C protein 28
MRLPFRKLPDKPQRHGFVDEQIDEAIKRGDFDNLQGKGKPLNLQGDLSNKKEMRTKLRHDAGFTAPWEETGREIEVAQSRLMGSARRAWEFRLAGLRSKKADPARIEADFAKAQKELERQVGAVNSLILTYNLLIPPTLPHLHRVRVKIDQVWEEIAPEWWAERRRPG